MSELKVKIINKSDHKLPSYTTKGSAGMDLRANNDEDIIIKPLERTLIKTGLFMEIPMGYEAQVRPRSGLALKKGISVLNSPGTIDSDYRGELCIILINLSDQNFTVSHGDRVAQLVFAKCEQLKFKEVVLLDDSDRGKGGFGSTGVN